MEQFDLPKAVAAYVPSHVICRVLDGAPPRPGEAESIEAAVLFADVAGFTTMAERMVRALSDQSPHEGHRGSEELNRLLNETFTALMQPVAEYGGIVTRFSGDAVTAYFERLPNATPGAVVACALSCAYAMQRAMIPFLHAQAAGNEFPISVKIGLGYGPALRLTVGDTEHGLESVLAGSAVDMATLAEQHARQGEVVARRAALELLDIQPPLGEAHDEFVVVAGEAPGAHAVDTRRPELSNLDEAARERLLAALVPYLPREVYDALSLTGGELPGDFRRVTSLFVGFEGISYDSPGVGQALQDYFRWAQDVVARFEGRVNHVITGDKGSVLHVLFGAPGKHDDDLIRALRCALALKSDATCPAFITSQRIGITSGIVLARPIGSELRREYTVIGDEINLSSRLMTACAPGAILVDSYTRDRTAQSFVFETLPPLQVKGKQFPVKAYRLMAEREITTSLTARYLASRWALVGRDAERAVLLAAADRAVAGHGAIIAISGRAGVGKTRLVEEIVRRWVDKGGDGYIGQCMSHGLHSPYLPWIDLWREFFGFQEADDAAVRFQKVESVIAADASAMSPWAGVLGSVLGLPGAESPAVAALDASDRRRKLFELALELLRARVARRPLLLLFEDVHWADRPSLDLIDYVASHMGDVSLLVCLCFRPRDDMNLQALTSPDCTLVPLEELGAESSAQMVRAVLNQASLPLEFEREIFDKTQGNPLFVEELLSSLIEGGVLERAEGGYRVVGDLSQVRVPDTLQDLIMARIDRLDPSSRDLLQVASVIDRRFAYDILRGIYPYRMADLDMRDRLEATIQVDLTRLDHPEPELAYLFKHAMTYDVAYNSLPFARRRELHDRVGDFLELAHLENLEQYYPVLARHFAQSERWDKTLLYALAAGSQAQELYANDEALSYYEQAEQCLGKLPAEMYWINALRLYLNRAMLYRLKGQYDLCEADINRALALAQAHEDVRAQAEAHNLLAKLRWWQARNEEALQSALQAYDLAGQSKSNAEMLTALRMLGDAHHALRQFDQAMTYYLEAHDLARQQNDQVTLGMILNSMGGTHYSLGHFESALAALQQSFVLLEKADLKYHVASCLINIGLTRFRQGQPLAALGAYQRAVTVSMAGGFQAGMAYAHYDRAEALSYLGEYTQAFAACEEGYQAFRKTNDILGESYIRLAQAADVCMPLGLTTQVYPMLEAALQVVRNCGDVEESMRALMSLIEHSLFLNELEVASSYLCQINELDQVELPFWQLSCKALLEGRLALAHGDFGRADFLTQEIERLINAGSNPDILGPMWVLRAKVALAHNNHDDARACFAQAVQAVHARSSFTHKLGVLNEAGAFLATDSDAVVAAQGRQWLEEAEAMQQHLDAERERYMNLARI